MNDDQLKAILARIDRQATGLLIASWIQHATTVATIWLIVSHYAK